MDQTVSRDCFSPSVRFFNHSCRPNVKTIEVHEYSMLIPRLCTIALRTICLGEVIRLDYETKWWRSKRVNEGLTCRCGEETCMYRDLPTHPLNDDEQEDNDKV